MPAKAEQSLSAVQRELSSRREILSRQIEEIDRALAGIAFASDLLSESNGHAPGVVKSTSARSRRDRPVPEQFDSAIRKIIANSSIDFSTTELVHWLSSPPINLKMGERDRDLVTRALRKLEEEQVVVNVQRGQGRRPAVWRRAK